MDPGELVSDRFTVERRAGSGGMATVYRASDRHTGETVALKVLGAADDHDGRFTREVALLAELRHPGIVRYVAHGVTSAGERWLAMEWLEGESLSARLGRAGLTPRQSLRMVRHVAEALALAHSRGVIHRDVKPSNLYLPDGDIEHVKLIDFGVARLTHGGQATRTGIMVGTPGYMAPEQARGDRAVDARADVFSLGCVLFECVAGRAAFVGDNPMALLAKILFEETPRLHELRSGVPQPLAAVVARMMHKDAGERPANGAALVEELAALGDLGDVSEAAPVVALPESLTGSENRLISVVLAAAALDAPIGDDAPTLNTGGDQPVRETPAARLPALREAIPSARLEKLADGSVVAALSGSGVATDQAAQAARMALAMRRLMPGVPMAVATGRGEVSQAGPVIDRAARLLRAHSDAIRLDEMTAGLLDGGFDVGGDSDGLELRGEREISPGVRTLLGKATPFVGRGRELSMLEAIFAECAAEQQPRAVLVTGPAGAGKTRLGQELVKQLGGRAQVWIGRGDPMKVGSPFGLIASVVRRAAGVLDGEPLEVRQYKLRARVARHVAEAPRVAAFLGELVGAPFPVEEHASLRAARREPMLMGDQIRQAWEEWVAAECGAGPVVLLLEDLHWGDLPTVKLVDSALRTLRGCALMVVALARPDVRELFPKLWEERGVTELRLAELTDRAGERLVREVLGDLPADKVRQMVAQAGGNAFYLEELIRAVAEGHDALPDTVLAMVQARLERLPPEARRLLRAASIFGQVFWKGGVATLLGQHQSPTQVGEWLATLAERELILRRGDRKFPGAEEYVFQHALVREAAYAMLTDHDRALGHRLAGAWLEQAGESDAVTLAEHFQRGGEPPRAVGWWVRAAAQAIEGNDLEAALSRAARGVECGADGELRGRLDLVRAEAHTWRGEYAQAEEAGLAAMRWLRRGGLEWNRAAEQVAEASSRLGHRPLLVALGEELRDLAGRELSRTQLSASQVVAMARTVSQLILSGELALGAGLLARFSPVLDKLSDDPAATAWGHDALAVMALYTGDLGGYLTIKEQVVTLFEKAGEPRSECLQRVRLGYACLELGDYARSVEELRRALQQAERMRLGQVSALAKHNLGYALARMGAIEEGRVMEAEAMELFLQQGDVRLGNAARLYLAEILAAAGRYDEAEAAARGALEVASEPTPIRAYACAVLADVALARGETLAALAPAGEAMRLLETLGGIDEGEALVRVVWAEALHATGDARAGSVITVARQRLVERAAKITDVKLREIFLNAPPENHRTMKHFAEWD